MLGHYTTAPGAPSVQLILLVRIDHTRGKIILSSLRIDSPKILLWQKRCLMRESYQPLLWKSQAAGRKRGHDEYDKPERAVGSGRSALPSGPRRGARSHPGGVPRQYRLPSQVCPELAQSSDHQGHGEQETGAPASVCLCAATRAGDLLASRQWHL